MTAKSVFLKNEAATETFGKHLAKVTQGQGIITLSGGLGMGKTTLSRGLIRAFGHTGAVKSPTYTIVEPYKIGAINIMHFDLYRLNDPEELEFLGFRDYLDSDTLCLIEWPERAFNSLPSIDLKLSLTEHNRGRQISWQYETELGATFALALEKYYSMQ